MAGKLAARAWKSKGSKLLREIAIEPAELPTLQQTHANGWFSAIRQGDLQAIESMLV